MDEVSQKSFTQSRCLVHAALVNRHHLEYTTHSRMYEYTCVCTKNISKYVYIYIHIIMRMYVHANYRSPNSTIGIPTPLIFHRSNQLCRISGHL